MKTNRLTLTLATVLTLMSVAARAERNDTAAEKLGFQLGMQCWTYRMLTTFETLERCQKFGLKYLEIFPGQNMKPGANTSVGPGMSDAEIAELRGKAKECGVKIASFGVSDIPMDESGMKKHFAWAKKVGLEVLVTEVTPNEALDKMAQEAGIRIALHNHPQSWPADKVLAATKDLSKNCGSCSDTGHWLRVGKDPVANFKLLEGRVIESHFKDLDDKKSDVVYGTGIANVKGMMQELKRQGFKGLMSIEYEHGDLAHLDSTIPLCVAAFDKIAGEVAKE
ncbi:MAG: sugar phosphate isomerase/epimerase [Verrucomicrobia bacterium]|nr:sugar phosphate isomerase/epimerase [Verrucomicrobiota bacterium]